MQAPVPTPPPAASPFDDVTRTTPFTDEEVLALWDQGVAVPTVQMGGIGDNYERSLQTLAFVMWQLIRENVMPADDEGNDVWKGFWTKIDNLAETRLTDISPDLEGMTGAQWSAARNLAGNYARRGYSDAVLSAPRDRIIRVKKWGMP